MGKSGEIARIRLDSRGCREKFSHSRGCRSRGCRNPKIYYAVNHEAVIAFLIANGEVFYLDVYTINNLPVKWSTN